MAKLLIQKFKAFLSDTIRQTTIEPIIFFNFLALPFFHVSQQAVLYSSICLQHYATDDDPGICDRLKEEPNLEDNVQKDASIWNMYLSLSYLLPAIASDMFLGAWSDRYGRKLSILLGFAGLICTSVAFIALAVFPRMPLFVLLLANVAAGTTGYVAIVIISCMAYLSDVVVEKKTLAFRMTLILIAKWVADVIGSFTTSTVLKICNPAMAMVFAQCFFALGFFYTLIILHQLPPETLKMEAMKKKRSISAAGQRAKGDIGDEKAGKRVSNSEMAGKPISNGACLNTEEIKRPKLQCSSEDKSVGCRQEFHHTLKFVAQLYKDVWETLGKRRKRHRRLHIFICIMVFFSLMLSEAGLQSGPLMSLYVFHRPFYWTPPDLGTYRGVQSVCSLLGSIIGAVLTKSFHFQETTIMLLSISSGVIHLALVGLSSWSWMLYLACIIGSFNSLFWPAVKALLASLVDPDEVGKAFAATGVAADAAFVFSTLMFTNMYRATVVVYPGAVFLFAAAILAFCLVGVLWMRVDYNRKNGQQENGTLEQPAAALTRPNVVPPSIPLASASTNAKEGQNGSIDEKRKTQILTEDAGCRNT